MRSRSFPRPACLAALAAATALSATCARNPATGRLQLSFISEAREIEMGRQYDQEVVAHMGLYPDPALQAYVQQLGSRLAARSERPQLPWTFRVVDDPVVNAFALPGGFIYVTRGILAHFQSEAQLTAVLGHEIGHVTARHSVNQMSKQQLAQIGLVLGTVIKPSLQRYAGLASAGLGVLFLKHGRDDEREADDLGLRYMTRGGFDPREMPGVFTMLGQVSAAAGGGGTPEWLSTHPNPENRRERIEAAISSLDQDFEAATVDRDGYLRRIDGLVFAENPRDGFFRGAEFLHPDLEFRLSFPEGWKTVNQRSAVIGISPREDAVMQLTLSGAATPAAGARAFFSETGLSGGASRGTINGLEAVSGAFRANADGGAGGAGGALRGYVAFVAYAGSVFRLLAYANEARWPSYDAVATSAIRSFDRLTDPTALDVQPYRLSLVSLERDMTLEQFLRRYPAPVPAAMLALINQLAPGGRFVAGSLAKRIVGRRLP